MPGRDAVTAYIGLGANLGPAAQAVEAAMHALDALPLTQVTRRSGLYRSAPVDATGPDFINAVVEVHTQLDALRLLSELQALESAAGRERPWHHAPRTLDLDLLLYGDARIDSHRLTVPHPRMAQRAFVLVPLAQIAPARVSREALARVAGQAVEPLTAAS